MPTAAVEEEIAKTNKTKRKRVSELDVSDNRTTEDVWSNE
jgi:hypothetical protein